MMNTLNNTRLPEIFCSKSPLEGGIKGGFIKFITLLIEPTKSLCRLRRLLPLQRRANKDFIEMRFFPRTTYKKLQNDVINKVKI